MPGLCSFVRVKPAADLLHYKDGKVSKGYSFPVQKGICRVRERYVKGRFDELVVAQR